MTICNFLVWPDRAIVGVDTLGVGLEGARGEVSKLLPLAHSNCVIAGRGDFYFLSALFSACHMLPIGFDDLAAAMPELLPAVFSSAESNGVPLGLPRLGKQEIALIGWSTREQRMCGYAFNVTADDVTSTTANSCVSPWDQSIDLARTPETQEDLLHLARAQVRWMRETEPERATGGRLMVAQVRKDSVQLAMAGELK